MSVFATGGSSASASGGSRAGAAGSTTSNGGFGPAPQTLTRVERLPLSRRWISYRGPKAQRRVAFVLRLRRPALIEFVLYRVAPDCTFVGKFRVRAHAGVNRVGFRGRIGRRTLPPGTYLIRARPVSANGGNVVLENRLVIFRTAHPTRSQVRAARAADTCPPPTLNAFGAGFGSFVEASASGGGGSVEASPADPARAQAAVRKKQRPSSSVLGVSFGRAAADAVEKVHPLIWLGLGMAIGLLGIAAVPIEFAPNARIAALLAYRRLAIALAGATLLAAVTVAYVFS